MTISGKNALLSTVSLRTLTITGAALASLTLVGACASVDGNSTAGAQPAAAASLGNPCAAAANPCNPCAAAANPCNPCAAATSLGNPCAAAANPCNPCAAAANPCNPCAAAASPCNPCAAAANPCNPCAAAANPCAAHTVAQGTFYDGPYAPDHRVSGNASISKAADGAYWLKFTQFVSDDGPDINIILSPAHAPKTDASIKQAGYITVAARTALTGDQSYRLPKDFDPEIHQSVGIWCEQFGVLFGAAQLQRL